MRPEGVHLSKNQRTLSWSKSYKLVSPAIMIGLFILGLANLSFVFICVKDKNKMAENSVTHNEPSTRAALADQFKIMPTELAHLLEDMKIKNAFMTRKHGRGPQPPLFLYKPLCNHKNNCRNITEKEVKNLFHTNGLTITEDEYSPWTVTLTNGIQGLPKVRKLWQHSNLFPRLSNVCLKEHLCLQHNKWLNQFRDLQIMKPCWDVNTADYRQFIESKAAKLSGFYLTRLAGGRHGSASKFQIQYTKAHSLHNFLRKNANINSSDTELRWHTTLEKYIDNPFLLNGRKHIIRVYLLIRSLDPLQVYLSDFGEVAFARDPYTAEVKKLKDECIHFDIWAQPQCFQDKSFWKLNSARSAVWTLDHYWWQLSKLNIAKDDIMRGIRDVLSKFSILMASMILGSLHSTSSRVTVQAIKRNGFPFLQLDMLLDQDLKPWILDVDCDPGFHHLSNPSSHKAQWLKQMILEYIQMNGYFRDEYDTSLYKEEMMTRLQSFCEKRGGCSEQDFIDLTAYEHSHHGRKVFHLIFPEPSTAASYTRLIQNLGIDTILHEYAVYLSV